MQYQSYLALLAADNAPWFSQAVLTTLADVAQAALLYDLAQHAGERHAKLPGSVVCAAFHRASAVSGVGVERS